MTVIRHNSENLLIAKTDELRHRKVSWWALWLHISKLEATKEPYALKILADTAEYLSAYGEYCIYVMMSGDAILLTQQISNVNCSKIMKEVTYLFKEDPIAGDGSVGERGNKLCTLYDSAEDLKVLSRLIMDAKMLGGKNSHGNESMELFLNNDLFQHALSTRRTRKQLCILVAEDQRFSRQIVMEVLGKKYEKIAAEDGVEALRLYEAFAPDIMFLDIDMPLVNGKTVLKRITEIDAESFIVMLTASQTQEDVEVCLKGGAMGYVIKPFSKMKIEKYIHLYHNNFSARGMRKA